MKTRLLSFLILILGPFMAGATSSEFPRTISLSSVQLEKIGEGTFRWMLFKVYDGAFYLDADNTQAAALDDVAKCLELEYNVSITAEDFRESGDTIVQRNVSEQTWQSIQDRLKKLNAAYQDVAKGDRYALVYVPGKGTTLSLNGNSLVTVEGADFARAYFSIWLGKDPVKASFRRALLSN